MDIYKFLFLISISLFAGCKFSTEEQSNINREENECCDSLEYQVHISFPDGFLLSKPSIELKKDTLKIRYLQKWKIQHNVLMAAIISRTFHILDSLQYLDNINGQSYSIVDIAIYSPSGNHVTSPVQLSLSSRQPILLEEWMFSSYQNMNYYILNKVDPSNYWKYDDLLGMYFKETNDKDFNLNFFDLYLDITENKKILPFQKRVLDSLFARSYRNSETIDPTIVRGFRDYFKAIELENEGEFEIFDQTQDGDQKK